METFMAWYSGNPFEAFVTTNRMIGPYAVVFWILIFCNVLTPQLLWFKRMRTSIPVLFIVSIIVNIGMWLERFMIVVVSLHRDFMPSAWGMYYPTFWDLATLFGSVGMFLMLMFLFIRVLPMISIFEMRELVGEKK
jgi:hypothetical protein